jgi:hypothetical protein
MIVSLEHDLEHDVWTIRHNDVHIRTSRDVDDWRAQLDAGFLQLAGQKAFILIDLSDFKIDPNMMDEYGKNAKEIVGKHALGAIRYGGKHAETKTEILLQSIANNFPANIFPDRQSALRAVEKMRPAMRATGT